MSEHSAPPSTDALRLAYLNTCYPALSHTFIQDEIQALRGQGVEVVPFSIRRPEYREIDGHLDAEEVARTVYLLDTPARPLWELVRAAFTAPIRCARLLLASQKLAIGGLASRLRYIAYAGEAARLCREMRARDLLRVHVHMANNGALVALLATHFCPKITYSLTIHGSAEFFDVTLLRLRATAEGATFVRCISEFCKAQVMAWTSPRVWSRFHVVHCGIRTESFPQRRVSPRADFRLLTIGRIDPIKGYPILLAALTSLRQDGPAWSLRIIGGGAELANLTRLVRDLGLSDSVQLLGSLSPSEVRKQLEATDALVLSSFMEGLPVVLMEAMAAGVAVIATQVGGIPELVRDGETGLLCTPASPEALTRAIECLRSAPSEAEERTRAAKQLVQEEYDVEVTAGRMRVLFEGDARQSP